MKLMKTIILALSGAALLGATASTSFAHGDKPHAKCKQGYVMTSDHRCVKKP